MEWTGEMLAVHSFEPTHQSSAMNSPPGSVSAPCPGLQTHFWRQWSHVPNPLQLARDEQPAPIAAEVSMLMK